MKNRSVSASKKIAGIVYLLAITGVIVFINACHKNQEHTNADILSANSQKENMPTLQNQPQTGVVNILGIEPSADGTSARIRFSRHQRLFSVSDATILAQLNTAFRAKTPVKILFNPWQGTVLKVELASGDDLVKFNTRQLVSSTVKPTILEANKDNTAVINHIAEMGIINTTTADLTPAIPDMATAQLIFNYFSAQCCVNPGPYTVDYCITFQYCEDGCYARAHKMCYLLNTKYHYATQKVFSFALGSDNLSVHAEKWGGCCINWWYHVAPLVTIITPNGPKAYVFDPAMFDQPVLLTAWLHAQENPACSGTPHVTSISIQPTAMYSPSFYEVTTLFDTDPYYADTDSTLVNYRNLISCP